MMESAEVGFDGNFLMFDCRKTGLKSIKLPSFNCGLSELKFSPNWNLNGKNKNVFMWRNDKENPELIYFNNNKYYKISFEQIGIE